jgi:hypothetical protein
MPLKIISQKAYDDFLDLERKFVELWNEIKQSRLDLSTVISSADQLKKEYAALAEENKALVQRNQSLTEAIKEGEKQ